MNEPRELLMELVDEDEVELDHDDPLHLLQLHLHLRRGLLLQLRSCLLHLRSGMLLRPRPFPVC